MDVATSILERAVEDYTGLWELIGATQAAMPHSTPTELRSAAENELRKLLERGWITLYRGVSFDGDQNAVTTAADDSLAEERNWHPPESRSEHLRIGATSAGERAYYDTNHK
jgi:hypothetical protein